MRTHKLGPLSGPDVDRRCRQLVRIGKCVDNGPQCEMPIRDVDRNNTFWHQMPQINLKRLDRQQVDRNRIA